MQYRILFFIITLLLSGCVKKEIVEIQTMEKNISIKVEVADTDLKRERGLMFRKKLGENDGMLFVFDDEKYVTFWMKNTLIPLDIIFISSNGTINEIKENVQPCLADPCELYPSVNPSKYVLEVNANFSKKNGISVGDSVKFLSFFV
jgi:uncharacterized membrane protein (UPF0127 family)